MQNAVHRMNPSQRQFTSINERHGAAAVNDWSRKKNKFFKMRSQDSLKQCDFGKLREHHEHSQPWCFAQIAEFLSDSDLEDEQSQILKNSIGLKCSAMLLRLYEGVRCPNCSSKYLTKITPNFLSFLKILQWYQQQQLCNIESYIIFFLIIDLLFQHDCDLKQQQKCSQMFWFFVLIKFARVKHQKKEEERKQLLQKFKINVAQKFSFQQFELFAKIYHQIRFKTQFDPAFNQELSSFFNTIIEENLSIPILKRKMLLKIVNYQAYPMTQSQTSTNKEQKKLIIPRTNSKTISLSQVEAKSQESLCISSVSDMLGSNFPEQSLRANFNQLSNLQLPFMADNQKQYKHVLNLLGTKSQKYCELVHTTFENALIFYQKQPFIDKLNKLFEGSNQQSKTQWKKEKQCSKQMLGQLYDKLIFE